MFVLGEHQLICGDARDQEIVAKLFGKEKASLILSDMPYGVSYVESKSGFKQKLGKEKTIANDHAQTEEEYQAFTSEWLEAAAPYLTTKNSLYLFNADKMIFAMREGMLKAGFTFTQLLIWAKSHAVVGRMDYLPQHELIAYGWYGKHAFQKSKDKSILVHPKPTSSKLHPTMKPIGLLRRLILNSSKVNDIVYDAFGGSGSTLIACEDTRRRCFMVELDPEYCAVICERFERHTGKKPELIASAYATKKA